MAKRETNAQRAESEDERRARWALEGIPVLIAKDFLDLHLFQLVYCITGPTLKQCFWIIYFCRGAHEGYSGSNSPRITTAKPLALGN
jgi:hypothetical protein